MSPLSVEVRGGRAVLADVRDEWAALLERDPNAGPFHRPAFLGSWAEEFAMGEPETILMRDDDRLDGLAFVIVEDGILRFLGDAEVTDYLGPIGEDRDAVAAGFVEGIASLEDWRTAELHGLAADTGWPEAIARAAKAAGWTVQEQQQDVCPRIDLTGGWDAYLERLPGKQRHEIRRKARRLERETGGFEIRVTNAATIERDLERFYEMHRSSDGAKGKFLHEGMASFFGRVAHAFLDEDGLRLTWLDVAGESFAAVLSFSGDGVFSVYNSAYDHAKRDLGPGIVLMAETIRIAALEGCGVFDLLRGDEPYKYRLGGRDVALLGLTLRRG